MPQPIRYDSTSFDLSKRFQIYKTVDASPSGSAETVVATLTLSTFSDISVVSGIKVSGWAAFTVAGSGTAVTMKIRQTNVSGSTIVTSGALTGGVAAGNLIAQDVEGFDAGAGASSYALTITVTAGSGASTVSAVMLSAIII
jgi:hypothetical protein